MKKILCFLAAASFHFVSAQISVNESFTTNPGPEKGFTFIGFNGSSSNPIPCSTGNRAMNKSFYTGSSTNVTNAINYSSNDSNGGKLSISFKYKHPPGSANASVNGTMRVEYSVDNGEFQLLESIELKKIEQFCQNFTQIIDEDIVTKGKNFKLKISGTYISGDFYLVVDDLTITQSVPTLAVEAVSTKQISVSPNPVHNSLRLSDYKNTLKLTITDMNGRIVKSIDRPTDATDVSTLKAGNYIATVTANDGKITSYKIIKK